MVKMARVSPQLVEAERERLAKERADQGEGLAGITTRKYRRGDQTVEIKAPARKATTAKDPVPTLVARVARTVMVFEPEVRRRFLEELQSRLKETLG